MALWLLIETIGLPYPTIGWPRRYAMQQAAGAAFSGLGDWGRHLWFDTSPAYGAASDGFSKCAEENDIHHLAVVEALKNQRGEKRPILVLLKGKSDHAREQIDHHEDCEEDQRAFHVL